MKRAQLLLITVGMTGLVGTALANEPAKAPAKKPDLAKAQQIASQVCAACHGSDGNSAAAANPSLAGQHADYIASQLANFKSGLRKNAIMAPMAATLSPEDMKALGVFFAEQKPKSKPFPFKGDEHRAVIDYGRQIYRGGIKSVSLPACASCHSPSGAGMPSQYPRLAGQFADYTFAQLKAFKAMERGGSMKGAEGKEVVDGNGKIMHEIAAKMSEKDMRAVADYIAALK